MGKMGTNLPIGGHMSHSFTVSVSSLNTLRPRQNGHHFADDTFKRIFFNENVWVSIKISLKFVPKGPINNSPALVRIMAWRRSGDKPLSEPVMVSLPTHICVTRPHWVKILDKIHLIEFLLNVVFYNVFIANDENVCHLKYDYLEIL